MCQFQSIMIHEDEGKEIRVVFCDISKAFDRVWHIVLLKQIESIGIQGPLLSWIKNYLLNRKQRVVINNSNSQWRDIKAGVPQGSILGPLLFIIFINDIVTDIQSTIKLFADDTSLYLIVEDPNETADSLNNDLTKIHDWATKWLVTFNAQKMETMTTSRKIDKPDHPPTLHGQQWHFYCLRTQTSWANRNSLQEDQYLKKI